MRARHWIQASRPLAQVNIAVPLLLGQAAAFHAIGAFSWNWLLASLVWGLLDHLFVVYANDFADHKADTKRRTWLSGGSGVVAEGKLEPGHLKTAAIVAALLLFLWSFALGGYGRPWTWVYAGIAVVLLWTYSFPPLGLGYRGGGEWLQGLGVGIGLPSLGYYLQTEAFVAPAWVLAPTFLLGACSNLLTSLPDVEADRLAEKRTFAVRYGVRAAQGWALSGIAVSIVAVATWTPSLSNEWRVLVAGPAALATIGATQVRDPLRGALLGSLALNALVGMWMVGMVWA